MTNTEMNRRINEMPANLVAQVEEMIAQGYGATGIVNNSMATLKQTNAIFQKVQG